jgi:ABC-type transport system involved in Fe-S cluster assembly fused permease/ATPase subunit
VTFIGAGALKDLRRSYAGAWGTEVKIQNTYIKKIGKEISGPRIKIVDIHNCPSLSTVLHADTIFVLRDGVIVERGSHHDLVGGDTLYRRIYESQ